MKLHCVYISGCHFVYIPDVTFAEQKSEGALCLYSGCHFVYITDVTFAFDYGADAMFYFADVTFV